MNTRHVLFFCFLSALCGGDTGLVKAATFTGTEGQSVTVRCHFSFSERRKLFCRGECTKENILIETTSDKADNGRYSIKYEGSFLSYGSIYVTIRQLTKSDSGRYMCGLRGLGDRHQDVDLIVKDAATTSCPTSTPSITSPQGYPGYFLPLLVCVSVFVLLLVVTVLLIFKVKKKRDFDGLNLDDRNIKVSPYENCPPPTKCEDPVYQSLSPASMDQHQIYSTLTHTQHT